MKVTASRRPETVSRTVLGEICRDHTHSVNLVLNNLLGTAYRGGASTNPGESFHDHQKIPLHRHAEFCQ